MMLQRNAEVNIWGWADPGEPVTVDFKNSAYKTVADKEGKWKIVLLNLKAGGPYTITLKATNTIRIKDILVGDIWVGSGQSNMELPMRRVWPLYQNEIAHSHNDHIRYLEVPNNYNFNSPRHDLSSGVWQKTNPETILNFSAVAYFFAKNLYEKYGVPIGIINSSLGGSPAEAWISEEKLKNEYPRYYNEAQMFKDSTLIYKIRASDNARRHAWNDQLNRQDKGYRDPQNPWYDPDLDTSGWSTMSIPGYWRDTKTESINGSVWFRKDIDIPKGMVGKPAKLNLGRIVDADSVWINGKFVGTTSYQYPPRWYKFPAGILREGKNTITIRVISERGNGGFVPDKSYQLIAGNQTIDLKGEWQYKPGVSMPSLKPQTFIRWKPVGLYNAMIAPLINYRIKGVIWYQGESNTDRPVEYQHLFSTMIRDWRDKWNQGNFPFLFVQLANFMEPNSQPTESNWARLRESQRQTLSLPNTGMAVTIDLGEWNDIHPLRKKEVGERLALYAKKVAYGEEDLVYSGPILQSMIVEGNKAVLTFNHVGSGLVAKDADELKEFAIAGKDGRFVWAKAEIVGDNKVAVWSNKVPQPKVVRYAWADNPRGANLYNKEGLPASPFSAKVENPTEE